MHLLLSLDIYGDILIDWSEQRQWLRVLLSMVITCLLEASNDCFRQVALNLAQALLLRMLNAKFAVPL